MIDNADVFASRRMMVCFRLGLMAIVMGLQSWSAHAVEIDDAAKSNLVGNQQTDMPWISGGVGDDAMKEMRKVAPAYNVHVLMTGAHGSYLAGIPFTVSRSRGPVKFAGVTDGPLLYLKLPAGSYRMTVDIEGAWQTRQFQIAQSGPVTKVRFVAKGE